MDKDKPGIPEIIDLAEARKRLRSTLGKNANESKDITIADNALEYLEMAFGVLNQVPESVIGMTFASHIAIGSFDNIINVNDFAAKINNALGHVVQLIIIGKQKIFLQGADEAGVRKKIIEGMKEHLRDYPEESRIFAVIKKLERMA